MEKEFALKNQNERMHTQAMLDEIIQLDLYPKRDVRDSDLWRELEVKEPKRTKLVFESITPHIKTESDFIQGPPHPKADYMGTFTSTRDQPINSSNLMSESERRMAQPPY